MSDTFDIVCKDNDVKLRLKLLDGLPDELTVGLPHERFGVGTVVSIKDLVLLLREAGFGLIDKRPQKREFKFYLNDTALGGLMNPQQMENVLVKDGVLPFVQTHYRGLKNMNESLGVQLDKLSQVNERIFGYGSGLKKEQDSEKPTHPSAVSAIGAEEQELWKKIEQLELLINKLCEFI